MEAPSGLEPEPQVHETRRVEAGKAQFHGLKKGIPKQMASSSAYEPQSQRGLIPQCRAAEA
jgi:hypothetical protein